MATGLSASDSELLESLSDELSLLLLDDSSLDELIAFFATGIAGIGLPATAFSYSIHFMKSTLLVLLGHNDLSVSTTTIGLP